MRLTAQFKRLNKLAGVAGVGARCAFCQFALRQTFNKGTHQKPNPDAIQVTCEWCGTKYNTPLPADPIERAVTLEIAHDTVADSYSTHRKRALHLWSNYHARVLNQKAKKKKKQQQTWGKQPQLTPAQKRRKEMVDAYIKLVTGAHRRARRTAPEFPDLVEILGDLQPGHYSEDEKSDFGREQYFKARTKQLDALAKLETIIFGEAQPVTLETSAVVATRFAEFERAKVEKAERDAAERAEQEKRRREASERRMSPAVEQPAPRAKPVEEWDFWNTPARAYDTRDAAPASMADVPDAGGVSVPADTTRGLVLRSDDVPPTEQSLPRFRTSRTTGRPYRLNGTPKR